MLKKLRDNRGLTFIEVMAAMIIISTTAIALYYMFSQGQVLILEQEHRRIVFEKAQKRLAGYRVMSKDENFQIQEGTTSGSEVIAREIPEDEDDEIMLTAEYTVDVELEESAYYRVSIKYTWQERSGRDYQMTLVDCYPLEEE